MCRRDVVGKDVAGKCVIGKDVAGKCVVAKDVVGKDCPQWVHLEFSLIGDGGWATWQHTVRVGMT